MTDLSHERCSELLAAYTSGELDARERSEVEEHLSSCRDCSLELAAIRSLGAAEIVPMTGVERDRLSAAVRHAVITAPRPAWSTRWGRRVAPALGAVAFATIAIVAFTTFTNDDPLDESAAGGTSTSSVPDSESAELDAKAAPPPQGRGQHSADTFGKVQGGTAEGTAGGTADESVSLEARAGTTTTVSEVPFAAAGLDIGSLVPSRKAQNIAGYDGLTPLANSAPNPRVASLITTCTERATAASAESLVATSATYYPSDDVLVIGFVWIDGSTGDLNYLIRGWRDGRCDRVTPIYRRGIAP
jgi:hypothetical protein